MATEKHKPVVVFIHGIAAHQLVFVFLRSWLWLKGFRTLAWGYRSVFLTIPRHGKDFRNFLREIDADPKVDEFHIVAHSMGGIVTRQALLYFRPKKLGRFVMLAVPNKGSSAARILSNSLFAFSKTLRQISDEEGSFVREQDFPGGVATGAIYATADRVVTRESSKPLVDVPLFEIYSGHNDLLIRPATARAMESFLRTGEFGVSTEKSSVVSQD